MEQLSSHPRILQNSYTQKGVAMVKRNMDIKLVKALAHQLSQMKIRACCISCRNVFYPKKCNRVFCQGTEIKRVNRLEVSIKIYRVLSTGSTNSVYSASRIKGKGNTSNINKSCYIDLCLPKSSLISSKDHRIAVKSDTNYHALRDKKNLRV